MKNTFPSYADTPQWKEFFRGDEISTMERHIEEKWISSTETHIHLDIYERKKTAPTIVYCHGLASCGRIMGHIAVKLFEKGYNVVCPDLVGFGISPEPHGSGNIPIYIQNLKDTITYVKRRFKSAVYLAGISLGGALTYYTACDGVDLNAISSYCLLDLSADETHAISPFPKPFIKPSIQILKAAARVTPRFNLPLKHMLNLETMSDYPELNAVFRSNPLAVKVYSFQGALSLLTTPPKIKFEDYDRIPILVVHGTKDRMIPERISRSNFERLKIKNKKYFPIEGCEHVPTREHELNAYISAMDKWFKKNA